MVFGFVFGSVSKIEREHGPSGYGHWSGVYTFQVAGLSSRFAENELYPFKKSGKIEGKNITLSSCLTR